MEVSQSTLLGIRGILASCNRVEDRIGKHWMFVAEVGSLVKTVQYLEND